MKPVVIYTMPRTRSNATLQACNRAVKLNEPFEIHNLSNYIIEQDDKFLYRIKTVIEHNQWESLIAIVNDSNTVSKVFGNHLHYCYHARKWFKTAEHTHEIFILIRNLREVMWSILLAPHFGYDKLTEKEEREIIIDDDQFHVIQNTIGSFLRFYPLTGKLVTFNTLPKEFFDVSKIILKEQHSISKLRLVRNIDRVNSNIDLMLSYFKDEWKDVTGLDIYA